MKLRRGSQNFGRRFQSQLIVQRCSETIDVNENACRDGINEVIRRVQPSHLKYPKGITNGRSDQGLEMT